MGEGLDNLHPRLFVTVVDMDGDGLDVAGLLLEVGDALLLESRQHRIVQKGPSGKMFINRSARLGPQILWRPEQEHGGRAKAGFLQLRSTLLGRLNRLVEDPGV